VVIHLFYDKTNNASLYQKQRGKGKLKCTIPLPWVSVTYRIACVRLFLKYETTAQSHGKTWRPNTYVFIPQPYTQYFALNPHIFAPNFCASLQRLKCKSTAAVPNRSTQQHASVLQSDRLRWMRGKQSASMDASKAID